MQKLNASDNIGSIKDAVLCAVAQLAFEGRLEEEKEVLPYELIPGPKAYFRCCIYKEREIIRQRIRLAEGHLPGADTGSTNVVQVISSACEECTLGHYQVSENCRRCVSKRCQSVCKFGAITMERDHARIDMDKCRECGQCYQACPYHAIIDLTRPCKRACPVNAISWDKETEIVKIDEEKCIHCGACIEACPFGAIGSVSSLVDVIRLLRSGRKVVALTAPAGEGQFGKGITMGSLAGGIKALGFADMVEVSLGADFTAAYEADEWMEAHEAGEKRVTSCCPAFVEMVKKHFPDLAPLISTTVSPMCAVSRLVKARDPDAVTVFIGPCIAKKKEIKDSDLPGNADYVLTYNELQCMFQAKGTELRPDAPALQQGSRYGKGFASSGGVTAAVLEAVKEREAAAGKGDADDIHVLVCNGAAECRKALTLLKAGRLPEDFFEGMGCIGGCVAGPGCAKFEFDSRRDRAALLGKADARGVRENVSSRAEGASISMHRS